jgi:hypothetical protein
MRHRGSEGSRKRAGHRQDAAYWQDAGHRQDAAYWQDAGHRQDAAYWQDMDPVSGDWADDDAGTWAAGARGGDPPYLAGAEGPEDPGMLTGGTAIRDPARGFPPPPGGEDSGYGQEYSGYGHGDPGYGQEYSGYGHGDPGYGQEDPPYGHDGSAYPPGDVSGPHEMATAAGPAADARGPWAAQRSAKKRGSAKRRGRKAPMPPVSPPSGSRRLATATRRKRAVVLSSAAALAVAVLGTLGYLFLARHSGGADAPLASSSALPAKPELGSAPPTPSYSARRGNWGHISSRADDKAPLTLGELYPAQFIINGSSFVRVAERSDGDCARAMFGSQLQSAVKAANCTQVMRASYTSADGTLMGTIGVANLATSKEAATVGQSVDQYNFIGPLDATSGPASHLSHGTGIEEAEVKGHYLIMTWVEFASLDAPSTTAERQKLEKFSSDLISGSANIALSTRMVTGKP